ncbi:MAG: hypothetical protein GY775_17720 [Candidatus Scalindua sp.]|nr:hypothetical protein [Candidatus Scalindua sp.]
MVGVQEVSFTKEAIPGLRGFTFWRKKDGFKIADRIRTLESEARGLVGC